MLRRVHRTVTVEYLTYWPDNDRFNPIVPGNGGEIVAESWSSEVVSTEPPVLVAGECHMVLEDGDLG
jgi:hypothetical protein